MFSVKSVYVIIMTHRSKRQVPLSNRQVPFLDCSNGDKFLTIIEGSLNISSIITDLVQWNSLIDKQKSSRLWPYAVTSSGTTRFDLFSGRSL